MTNDLGERRDLADEADSEEYQAMFETVRAEMAAEMEPFWPSLIAVHEESMRRLKAKYESACGK